MVIGPTVNTFMFFLLYPEPVTEMSTSNISWGVKTAGAYG
jgi:hypothetical protein